MSLPLVSAVIPTYNYGHFIVEAVESALSQTYLPMEVIVVDDGSTDDTRLRLEPYMSRIRYIHQKNRGLSAARNTGIEAADGKWIAFLDSDDRWHPCKTEIQVRHFCEYPSIRLVATDTFSDMSNGWSEVNVPLVNTSPITLEDLFIKNRFAPSSVLIEKSVFQDVGNFDTELRSAEDRDMWIRAASVGKVKKIHLPLTFYRIHSSSMSANAGRMEANTRRVLQKSINCLPELQTARAKRVIRMAWAYCDYECAFMYRANGDMRNAFSRLLHSLYTYPRPFRSDETHTSYARVKMLLMLVVEIKKFRERIR